MHVAKASIAPSHTAPLFHLSNLNILPHLQTTDSDGHVIIFPSRRALDFLFIAERDSGEYSGRKKGLNFRVPVFIFYLFTSSFINHPLNPDRSL